MRIIVLGAGVVGVAAAWALARRGHAVTLIERCPQAGMGVSAANGAQLAYSFVAPLASPDTLTKLPSLLIGRAAPTRLAPGADPDFLRWSIAFLRACTHEKAAATTAAQLALAALSRAELHALTQEQKLDYGWRVAGKLILYRKPASWAAALRQMETQAKAGGAEQQALDPRQCLETEPNLKLRASDLAGGVFTPSEEVGDCAVFCRELAARFAALPGARALYAVEARRLVRRAGRVIGVETGEGVIEADLVMLAAGAQARALARGLRLDLPIAPIKGHSITVRPAPGAAAPRVSVTDFERKIVYAPLTVDGEAMVRVAAFADFVGDKPRADPKRIARLLALTQDTAALDLDGDVKPWAGLRPATPDSRPMIGPSPIPGLFLNVGFGGLGWTLACGAARLAADLIDAVPPPVEPRWFALER
jgi:D-amino-acid dehydrogenase